MAVRILIDRLLVERGMSVGDFAAAIGITPANVAVLKTGALALSGSQHSTQYAESCAANRATSWSGMTTRPQTHSPSGVSR